MSRDKPKRAAYVRRWTIRFILLFSSLGALACGVFAAFGIHDGLREGRVYSLAIVLGSGAQVRKDTSPAMYWAIIGFYGFCVLAGIGLGIVTLVGNLMGLTQARETKEVEHVQR
jgi:hypothetical protein